MVSSIRHTGIVVKSGPKAVKFYQQLGFCLWHVGTVDRTTAKIFYGDAIRINHYKLKPLVSSYPSMIELYDIRDKAYADSYWSNRPHSFNHVSLTVKGIDEVWEFFRKKKLLLSQTILEVDRHKLFFAYDLDGNLLELVEPQ